MASSIFDRARELGTWQGLEQGLAKGRLQDARQVCAAFVKRHHAGVAPRVLPAIEACTNVARLHRWTLRMSELSADDVLHLVFPPAKPSLSRHRSPRPARRSRRASAR
jgi:hypothetical protein